LVILAYHNDKIIHLLETLCLLIFEQLWYETKIRSIENVQDRFLLLSIAANMKGYIFSEDIVGFFWIGLHK